MSYTLETPPLDMVHLVGRVALSAALGAAIGMEREWRERAAGLRTHVLVAVGSAVFTIISAYGFADFYAQMHIPSGVPSIPRDPGRIAAQVVSGIGFLGGGVILRSGLTVRGLTTAATLWATAAIGMAVGSGMYVLGALTAAAVLMSLIGLRRVNDFVYRRYHTESVRISLKVVSRELADKAIAELESVSERFGGAVTMHDEDTPKGKGLAISADLSLKPGMTSLSLARHLSGYDFMHEVSIEGIESDA